MKFQKLLFVPLLFTFLVSGCNGSSEKVNLTYGSFATNELTNITHSELSSKVDNKESFLVVVSPMHESCMCWVEFKRILNNYIAENHLIIYEISYNSFFDTSSNQLNAYSLEIRKDMETFAIFSNGVLKNQNVYSSSNSIFKQPSAFKEYIDENVYKPLMYYVSLEQLDSIYTTQNEAVIYFARSNCPDCAEVEKDVLLSYFKNNLSTNKLYILDCENIGIREYDDKGNLTSESQIKWQEFKDEYGLSSLNNATYGYSQGYVPTFQLIKGNNVSYASSIISSSVFFNDTLIKDGDIVKISESFYSESRKASLQYVSGLTTSVLKGLTVNEGEYRTLTYNEETYYLWNNESALVYHKPLLEAFLNYALPQVTHNF